jgi:hypothetical protein
MGFIESLPRKPSPQILKYQRSHSFVMPLNRKRVHHW